MTGIHWRAERLKLKDMVAKRDGRILVGGRFTMLGGQPRNCLARLNSDAYEDIVVANHGSNTISVLMNLGGGMSFAAKTDYAVGQGPVAVNCWEVSGDGRQDVVVANQNSTNVSVLLGLGGGALGLVVVGSRWVRAQRLLP
jgi:hypothetical protein